jgi:hypothetical protein
MTSESKSVSKRWRSPTVLIRLSSVLFVGLMIGHMSAYPWTSTNVVQEMKLIESMKYIPFEFMGERSTYWNLYFGWGLLVGVLLLAVAIILWLLSDLAHIGSRSVGIISGIVSTTSLVGAYLSFRFFYIPPFLFYSAICVILTAAAMQLLRRQDE